MVKRKINTNRPDKSLKIAAIIISILSIFFILFPFLLTVSNSVKDNKSIYDVPPSLIPKPTHSMSIVIDYTNFDMSKGEVAIKNSIEQDVSNSMYAAYSNINDQNISEVKYYAIKDGKVISYARSHKIQLQMEQDYGIFKGVVINDKTLLLNNRSKELAGKIGIEFNLDGLDGVEAPDTTDTKLLDKFSEGMENQFNLIGNISLCSVKRNNLLLLENFKHYMKLPQYVYQNNEAINKYGFFVFIVNSIIVIGFAIIAQVILCSICAFAISRLMTPKSGKIALMFFLGAMMIPFVSIMLPQLIMYKEMGAYDNFWALLLPFLYPYGFYVYLYKGFFDKIPESLFEAARLDGASVYYLYSKICMPLSKPIISMIALQTFLGNWNDFFWAWLVTERQEMWTLNVALYNISNNSATKQNALMGISIVTILPVIIATIIFSRQLKENIVSSGIKG
ncbi:multiple sugar transport system permease [Enterococcus sp. DIV0421]|uniref:carbohydrate ABC transporter permease n=1 Tax=Enterococcus sp. DIV0421 TaxID=2774688 RepID=UPI003F250931